MIVGPIAIRVSSERIRRAISQYHSDQISEIAASEILRQEILELDPILQPFNKTGALWPAPILKLILDIHESGLTVPLIERMYRRQDRAVPN